MVPSFGCGSAKPTDAQEWKCIESGKLADVYVEKAFFSREGFPSVYVHVCIKSKSSDVIGVERGHGLNNDLSEHLFYVADWQASKTAVMPPLIVDYRYIQPLFDEKRRNSLIDAYKQGKLEQISPGQSLSYYVEFGKQAALKQVKEDYVMVFLSGFCYVTNGQDTELSFLVPPSRTHCVPIGTRREWLTIPSGSLILMEPEQQAKK